MELSQETTVSKMETVQMEGQRKITREIEVYNLDAAIAVGCPKLHSPLQQNWQQKLQHLL